jgi:hypothetical protein
MKGNRKTRNMIRNRNRKRKEHKQNLNMNMNRNRKRSWSRQDHQPKEEHKKESEGSGTGTVTLTGRWSETGKGEENFNRHVQYKSVNDIFKDRELHEQIKKRHKRTKHQYWIMTHLEERKYSINFYITGASLAAGALSKQTVWTDF